MRVGLLGAAVALLVAASGCSSRAVRDDRRTRAPVVQDSQRPVRVLRGKATWYGKYHHGRKTASGERFNRWGMTAAHRSLRLGTRIRVVNVANGKAAVVRINDRGPFGRDRSRIIDLSEAAARKLDMIRSGWARVRIEVLSEPPPRRARRGAVSRRRKR